MTDREKQDRQWDKLVRRMKLRERETIRRNERRNKRLVQKLFSPTVR
jgi:hypothetical protein